MESTPNVDIPRLTPEQQARALALVERLKQRQAEILAERGGEPLEPPSWVLANEARDERGAEPMVCLDTTGDGLGGGIVETTERLIVPRLTPEEQKHALETLERVHRHATELLEYRKEQAVPESWELINEARDERTEQLP